LELDEPKKLGLGFIITFTIIRLLFYKEEIITVFRVAAAFYWLLILPGIGITYLWKLDFVERFVLSITLSAAIIGIFSYYLGLVGIHVKTSAYLLPVLSMIVGGWIWKNYGRKK
jgi:uncharacterized membrane protein